MRPLWPLPGFSAARADKARVWQAVKDDASAAAFLRDCGTVFGECAVRNWTVDGELIVGHAATGMPAQVRESLRTP